MDTFIGGFCLRPYADGDLARLLAFVGECFAGDTCQTVHPGDVLHCMSNAWRGQSVADYFSVCEDDQTGALAGLVMLYPARYASYFLVVNP
ncbi:MAG: hypothetical protein LC121_05100, partial [Anaerolineae bacterium]|nr:hypothetical protein [Anaerolineae bacterium]